MKFLKLFAGLKKKREFERKQLPFVASLVDYDIIIEIGFAQERNLPLTLKQLYLLKIASDATVRRRLAKLTAQGAIKRSTNASDHRSDCLELTASSLRVLDKYGGVLAEIAISI